MIVTIGEALVDVVGGSPRAGGAPANVAAALAKLGSPAAFVGALGCDERGDFVVAALAAAGVELRGIVRLPDVPTRAVFVAVDGSGDRVFTGFEPPAATFADTQLSPNDLDATLIGAAAALVCGSLSLAASPSREANGRATSLAHAAGVRIVLDVNRRDVFWSDPAQQLAFIRGGPLPVAAIVKASVEEADWLFGSTDPATIRAAQPQLEAVLITDGVRGCRYAVGGSSSTQPAFAVSARETTGAGDAFLAGFLHSWLGGATPRDAVRFASAAGALATLGPGAIEPQPSAEDVRAFLASESASTA